MPPTAAHRSPTGQLVIGVSATGCQHRAGSQDGARANAIDVLQRHTTSDRMAARMEQYAADVAQARAESAQATSQFQPSLMREQRAEQDTP